MTFSEEIRALRPIGGGEVRIPYFKDIVRPTTVVTYERQRYCLDYTTECACLVCGWPSDARDRNDEDRPIKSVFMSDIGGYNYEMVHS